MPSCPQSQCCPGGWKSQTIVCEALLLVGKAGSPPGPAGLSPWLLLDCWNIYKAWVVLETSRTNGDTQDSLFPPGPEASCVWRPKKACGSHAGFLSPRLLFWTGHIYSTADRSPHSWDDPMKHTACTEVAIDCGGHIAGQKSIHEQEVRVNLGEHVDSPSALAAQLKMTVQRERLHPQALSSGHNCLQLSQSLLHNSHPTGMLQKANPSCVDQILQIKTIPEMCLCG